MSTRYIYKYTLKISDKQVLELPRGAEILEVAEQGDPLTLCLWAMVDPMADVELRAFAIVGTGHPIPPDVERQDHVGTVATSIGFVWHVFEASSPFAHAEAEQRAATAEGLARARSAG